MKKIPRLALCVLSISTFSFAAAKNVLFIAIDDLRPDLGCYGNPAIKSPAIDQLAAEGMLFNRAYCQQAVCSPSRTSILTGLRPESCGVIDLHTFFRDTVPDVITLPQHFKAHGYHCESIGKIAHKLHMQDDEKSWSVPSIRPYMPEWIGPENKKIHARQVREAKEKGLTGMAYYEATLGPAWDIADVSDDTHMDGVTAGLAVKALEKLKKQDQPFFLGVGFIRPHLPFSAPKKYWDLYAAEDIQPSAYPNYPKDTPPVSPTDWGELRPYLDIPKDGPVSAEQNHSMKHGYYACVSYVDAQVGRVLDSLRELGMEDDTVIVLWGDHGWKLGDYGSWCKHTVFEIDARVPLIIKAPGRAPARTDALVELVDIYPTLTELCGLPLNSHLEGDSLVPLLEDPSKPWKKGAFNLWPRRNPERMGRSVRSDRWRYTEWKNEKTGEVTDRELHDHSEGSLVRENLANRPEYAATVREMSKLLNDGWRASRPQ